MDFDPFTASATDVQAYLSAGHTTSVALLDIYLNRIAKDNGYLKAVIATTSREILEREAKRLDDERIAGRVRGPLHGVPILLKDNIATHRDLGLDTTGGSLAFVGSRPLRNAPVAQKLIDAGAIILGKASLSELNFYRSDGIPCGWCAVSGQAQSAYVNGGFRADDSFAGHSNPGGSSSGSAISISAGFAPVAIGTETYGSLIMPADRAALYTIKPTVGIVPQAGIIPISPLSDAAGPMTKTVRDMANLLDIMVDVDKTRVPDGGYASMMTGKWEGISVGVLNPRDWFSSAETVKPVKSATEQMLREIEQAYEKLGRLTEVKSVSLISQAEATQNGDKDIQKCFAHDFAAVLKEYLDGVDNSQIKDLDDLIRFNEEHAAQEMPPRCENQAGLLRARSSTLTQAGYDDILSFAQQAGRERGIDKTLKDNAVDVIVGPAGGPLCMIAAIAGYPIASLPLGYLYFNGRPFGLAALASGHQESLLIKVASAWEATFPERRPPPLLAQRSGN